MKQTRLFILTIVLLSVFRPLCLWAEPVSESQALQQARAFLVDHGRGQLLRPMARAAIRSAKVSRVEDENAAYYVFNLPADSGFVVVSGEDKVASILAYSLEGSMEKNNMPEALRDLLDSYAEQIAWIRENGVNETDDESPALAPSRTSMARSAIAPLLQMRWNQTYPYNLYCPVIQANQSETLEGDTCVVGCVATAMAQVMKYHQWPTAATTAIPGYTSRNGLFVFTDELPATTFDWANMTNTYSRSSSDATKTAVATLMKYCGQSVEMNYLAGGKNGSSAFNQSIVAALKNYFDYDPDLYYTRRASYSYQEWIDLLYGELAAARPVIMGAQASNSGHAFVCDGYADDDYFHLNWGWSGSGDGYYRLLLLNPVAQGFGGSSSQDGFGYSQDAIIGVKPRTGGVSGEHNCMVLHSLCFGMSDTDKSKVYERASSSNPFTDIELYCVAASVDLGSNVFDYAFQLSDADGTLLATGTTGALNIESTVNATHTVSIPASVPDGTYTIKMLARKHDEATWRDMYDNNRHQMTAVISDNTLTITTPFAALVRPTYVGMTFNGPHLLGYEDTVLVSLTGVTDWHDDLILKVNGTKVMGKQADVPAGETVAVQYVFTPNTIGANTVAIMAGGTDIGSSTVNIAASDASDTLELSFSPSVSNLSGAQLYGNAFVVNITATNASTTHTYVGWLNCSVRRWTSRVEGNETIWEWVSVASEKKPMIVPKKVDDTNGTVVVPFNIGDLKPEAGAKYSFRITYKRSDQSVNLKDALHLGYDSSPEVAHGTWTVGGYALGNAQGERTNYDFSGSGTIDCGAACFVDLQAAGDLSSATITPSTNPNCLYLLAAGAETPSALSGKNVVKGTAADKIELVDGYDFYSPVAFTASAISYTRTFTLAAAAGGKGWNTLCLPFTVGTIMCEGMGAVDWFHSASDVGKNFWLRAFSADASTKIYFDYADALEANTPYLIAVPGDTWGEEYQMTGKAVTFSATNAPVAKTSEGVTCGNYFKFSGSTVSTSLTNVYELNAEGGKFDYKTSTTTSPFRAWVQSVNITSLTLPSISIGSGVPTELERLSEQVETDQETPWYTIMGLKLAERPQEAGVYIHNRQVVIIR